MRIGMIDCQAIRKRWEAVGSKLDERGRRVFATGEVRAAGWGGLEAVSEITGLARSMDAAAAPPIILPSSPRVPFRRVAAKTIRLRDKEHCKFVATQPCVVCGRAPSEAHHIRFAQPRALGRKVSDEYTVPVCRLHHRELHAYGDEASWWAAVNIDPLPIALELWRRSRSDGGA